MSKLDQFASAFRSSTKAKYHYTRRDLSKVMVVSDLGEGGGRFAEDVRSFLSVVESRESATWSHYDATHDIGGLLALIEEHRPDLVCCYRNLYGNARAYPFSLGSHVDVLTQATTTPVVLLPSPTEEGRLDPSCENTDRVMVLTDHLTGNDTLIDYGMRLTSAGGKLFLAHLEDDDTFHRYMDVISKIPAIDTDTARDRIRAKLMQEPSDYIESVRARLAAQVESVKVEGVVRMGHRVSDCQALITDHEIDLVVINTKDEDQLAMHGLAYPIAVELRDLPIVML